MKGRKPLNKSGIKQLSDKLLFTSAYAQSQQQQMQAYISETVAVGQPNFTNKLENGRQAANVNGFCYSNSSTLLSPYNHQQASSPHQLENSHMNFHINNNNNNNNSCDLMCNAAYDTVQTQTFFDPNDIFQMNQPLKPPADSCGGVKMETNANLAMTDLNLSKSPQTVLDLESGTIHNRQCDTCETYDVKDRDLITCVGYKYESSDDSASLVSSSSVFDDGYYSIPMHNEYNFETYVEQSSNGTYHQPVISEKEQNINFFHSSPSYYPNSTGYDSYSYSTVAYMPEYVSFEVANNQYCFESN